MKVLLVDDEAYFRSSVARSIPWEQHGLQILCVGDGEEAYALLQNEAVDVMLTDIKMPKMDGLELLERLQPENRAMEIIMLSCYNEFELVRKAMTLGATDYLFKPTMYPRDILAAVLKACERLEKRLATVDHFGDMLEGKSMETVEERAWARALQQQLAQGMHLLFIQANNADDVLLKHFGDNAHRMCLDMTQRVRELLQTEHVHARGASIYIALTTQPYERLSALADEFGLQTFTGCSGAIRDCAGLRDACREAEARSRQAMLENVPGKADDASVDSRIDSIVQFMSDHLGDTTLSLPLMAQRACMSKNAFANRFKECKGDTFLSFLTKMRVRKAKELYCSTDMKIYEIAEAVGYSDWHYLYQVYKKYEGHSLSREPRRL